MTESKDQMNALKEQCNILQSTVDSQKDEIDNLEQYSRRNCLLIHGVKEDQDQSGTNIMNRQTEDTDTKVLNLLHDNLHLNIHEGDIDRSHRLGKAKADKTRPIIVKHY